MHAKYVPVILRFAAEHHAPACGVNGWGFNRVVIQGPNQIAHGAWIIHAHGKMDVRGQAEILFTKMICGLLPST